MHRRTALRLLAGGVPAAWLSSTVRIGAGAADEQRLLYVAQPGIRNYVEYGGIGILVFDITRNYAFVRRIPSQDVPAGEAPENVKGIAAHAGTARVYVSTIKRVMAFDLATDRKVWDRVIDGGADRLAIAPDGALLYVPSLEGPVARAPRS
jgi:DNA-binding beta-propeller fold protein YncE